MQTIRLEVRSVVSGKQQVKKCQTAKNYLGINLDQMEKVLCYKIEVDRFSQDIADIFYDSVMEEINDINDNQVIYNFSKQPSFAVEVFYRPGVTDNPARTAKDALKLLGQDGEVASGAVYFLFGKISREDAIRIGNELLGNDLIQEISIFSIDQFYQNDRFTSVKLPKVVLGDAPHAKEISLNLTDDQLVELSQSRCLALSISELRYLRDYYLTLDRNPTDVELEVIAQTWSEHCKHKIFSSEIDYSEDEIPDGFKRLGNKKINGLYKTYIKNSTRKIEKERELDWAISVFSDNAGIVRFDKNVDFCIKVETHNSPSALDPYGGALTGILGVNRDILGTGMGARPIANMDVFCLGPPDWPTHGQEDQLPVGLKHPRRILEGVHQGVEDGGNKSGIPTVNGAIFFDKDYAGKPLIFVGTVGVLPQKLNDGRASSLKYPSVNDRIVMVGGAVGSDGIHGATFSSLELNESSPSTAVQIGDPITQKRAWDFLLEARDQGLYSSITDNGAGGLSSSVGEMALATGGASIDLSLCPVKYPGLSPYELMISESQERMTVAVSPSKLDQFLSLAKRRGAPASDLGEFNDSGKLEIYYDKTSVGELTLDFLHQSPEMKLKARFDGPCQRKKWSQEGTRKKVTDIKSILLDLLSSPNIASKESWVRRYDHEVQGATHVKPFTGKNGDGPSDSGVIWAWPHGGEKDNAICIGMGMAPRISLFDPYQMASFAVDEAIRNVVVTGGDIDTCCLLDNFCWPDPVLTSKNIDGDYKLGQLVRTCEGLYDICNYYGTPLVSGKDSMKNDFRGKNSKGDNIQISILPTLMVTAMAKTSIQATVTTDFKNTGDVIYILGVSSSGFFGSEFLEIYDYNDNDNNNEKLPLIDIEANKKMYRSYFTAAQNGLISSGHDLSDGGLLTAVSESMIGGELGAEIESNSSNEMEMIDFLFNEGPGRFLVSVKMENVKKFEEHFQDISYRKIGQVCQKPQLKVSHDKKEIMTVSLSKLCDSWKKGF